MKVLVVGSNGMLGHDLLLGYECTPHKVIGFGRCDLDIRNSSATYDRILEEKPDWVILTAAYTKVDDCESERELAWAINVEGTLNVARACLSASSGLCYISTDYIFNGESEKPYSEEDSPDPLNYYAKTKLAGENLIRETLSDYLIIRTSWLFGTRGRNFVSTILKKARSENILNIVKDQTGAPTYTGDLVDVVICLIDKNVRGIINVTNKGFCSWFDFAKEILLIAGVSGIKVNPISSNSLGLPAKRPANSRLALDKLQKTTKSSMRTWQEALEVCIREGFQIKGFD